MKLYDSPFAPNPRRVRIFLAEKGLQIPTETVELGKMQHRTDEFRALNPREQTPVLVLDDGSALSESVAICRFIEELHPEPSLFGASPRERAFTEMWNRRMELGLLMTVQAVFRHLHPAMAQLEDQCAAWGEANKPRLLKELAGLDAELTNRPYVAGDQFTIADITALCAVDFMRPTRIPLPEELVHLKRWKDEVSARPSASA
ncbi:glutathione S-transferase [Alsobacter soli]|uniref:Glutathione S-transferase n=1 Tax=Alsobacter soli TaxID=2109933 RepID=A0A2T1HVS3_9HYPH|nr:glutathione S-transferase family protein [Alsobacter soli]PSC05761.1 glutathione S-transferase [Alsobacter soli]